MSEGEFKKRAVHEAVIDVDDIVQSIQKDEQGNAFLSIGLPDEKYLVRMKDLFCWLDDARKEFPLPIFQKGKCIGVRLTLAQEKDMNKTMYDLAKWFLKYFGGEKQ